MLRVCVVSGESKQQSKKKLTTKAECRAAADKRRADSEHKPLQGKQLGQLQVLMGKFVLAPRVQLAKLKAELEALSREELGKRARARRYCCCAPPVPCLAPCRVASRVKRSRAAHTTPQLPKI